MARKTQKEIVEMYRKKGTNVSLTCAALGVARKTFYDWKKTKPKLVEALNEVDESLLDFAESKLMKKIDEDDTTCILFYLRTKGKDRGYVERVENDLSVTPFFELMQRASLVDEKE